MDVLRRLLPSTLAVAVVATAWSVTAPHRAGATGPKVAHPPGAAPAAQSDPRPAWTMPPEYRDVQLASLESQRRFLLAMADSMPERHYGTVDNPGQRTFAGHVYHAAVANAQAVDRFIEGPDFVAPDEATATASRAALAAAVDAGFTYIERLLRSQSEGARQAEMRFAGRTVPGWQFWDELNEHTYWTLGEVVGNFRSHGMAPPGFRFF